MQGFHDFHDEKEHNVFEIHNQAKSFRPFVKVYELDTFGNENASDCLYDSRNDNDFQYINEEDEFGKITPFQFQQMGEFDTASTEDENSFESIKNFESLNKDYCLNTNNVLDSLQSKSTEGSSILEDLQEDINLCEFQYNEKFRKLENIGKGSEANVYLCTSSTCEDLFVYKEFKDDKSSNCIEAKKADNLQKNHFTKMMNFEHDNIVQYLACDLDKQGKLNGIFMENMAGGALNEINNSEISSEQIIDYLKQISESLQYIHENGFVHGDLKPQNLLLSMDKSIIKLADIGFGNQITIPFLSPEVFTNVEITEKSDVWAFGCIIIYLLTGQMPYQGIDDQERLKEIMRTQSPLDFVKEMLSKNHSLCMEESDDLLYKKIDFAQKEEVQILLENCFSYYPEERATFEEISNYISRNLV